MEYYHQGSPGTLLVDNIDHLVDSNTEPGRLERLNSAEQLLEELVAGGVVCPDCGKGYKHKKSLYFHRKYECRQEPKFACPYCDKKTHQKGNLRRHVYLCHLSDPRSAGVLSQEF